MIQTDARTLIRYRPVTCRGGHAEREMKARRCWSRVFIPKKSSRCARLRRSALCDFRIAHATHVPIRARQSVVVTMRHVLAGTRCLVPTTPGYTVGSQWAHPSAVPVRTVTPVVRQTAVLPGHRPTLGPWHDQVQRRTPRMTARQSLIHGPTAPAAVVEPRQYVAPAVLVRLALVATVSHGYSSITMRIGSGPSHFAKGLNGPIRRSVFVTW